MDALLQLAERCEKATGPDRELDAAIYNAFPVEAGRKAERLPMEKWGDRFDDGWRTMRADKDDNYPEKLKRYTASLDAALELVPHVLDPQICKGPMFALAANATHPWGVSLIGPARDVDGEFGLEIDYDSFDANGATAPLAICAAALRARGESDQ